MEKFLAEYLPREGHGSPRLAAGWEQEGKRAVVTALGRAGEQVSPIARGGEQWVAEGGHGGLRAQCEVRAWPEYQAVEWVARLSQESDGDSPLLERIAAADVELSVPDGPVTVYHARGSTCEITDFLPLQTQLAEGEALDLAPAQGRSSNATFPFLNIAWDGGGVVVAIGWSAQWAARVERTEGAVRLWVGQEHTRLRLHAGEQMRTPRVLLVFWQGDEPLVGNNALRQVLIESYLPRRDGELAWPPVAYSTWFAFNEGNDVTEANQIEVLERLVELDLGVEVFWIDAGWFEGGWPHGAGSWVPKAQAFPRGLGPVAEAVHARGLRFLMWFEPERVNPESRIAREHPEFVLWDGPPNWTEQHDGLFNLGDPQARRYLTDLLSRAIEDFGLDIYRNDFNIDPLAFLRAADQPEREGMAEVRYVEGLYEMWDELLRRHPGLVIDNCASGGRRIDLETVARSLPLWRSDTQCTKQARPVFDQVQTSGLTRWVPLHSAGVWGMSPYEFWSVAQGGVVLSQDARTPDFPADLARARIAELKRWRNLWLGDFWPLTPVTTSEQDWCAWQLHDPAHGTGLVMAFRRAEAPEAVALRLREIDPGAGYVVRDELTAQGEEMLGQSLASMTVEAESAPGVRIISYWKL